MFVADVAFTLSGQPASYWAGDYSTAVEANPFAYPLLALNPWLFASLAAIWMAILSGVILLWRHPISGWLAVGLTVLHAIGGSSWLLQWGWWGIVPAGAYLLLAAQASGWCWRRYSQFPDRKG
jgi:CHASE2 domain-containing sensor protein